MPEMLPDEIPSHAGPAETTIFNTFKHGITSTSGDWIIFNSIEVPQRINPSSSRVVNFIIFIPDLLYVVCILVKGKSFRFPWSKSDIDLVHDIMEDLRTQYETTHFRDDSPLSLGCAVVLVPNNKTHEQVEIVFADGDRKSVDLDSLEDTLEDYFFRQLPHDVDALAMHPDDWDKAQEELLVKLRSDLVPIDGPTEIIYCDDPETSHRQLLRLTMDQLSSLDHVELNDRCVIDGAAGTGKTVLAKELAKRRCEKGEIVGLLCSNRYLIDDFEKSTAAVSNNSNGRIIAGTPATLPGRIFGENIALPELSKKHEKRLDDSPELEQTLRLGYLNDGWEEFIENTVKDIRQVIDNKDPDPEKRGIFDYLIVDEAQNLCDEVFLKLMDALLKQGLAKGKWTMFGDFRYQTIVTLDRNEGTDVLKNFGEGIHWSNDRLRTNCRNTNEISDAVANLVEIKSLPRSGVYGPHVEIKIFDSLDELNEMLKDLISTYRNKGRKSTESILLSSHSSRDNDVFDELVNNYGGEYAGWKLRSLHEGTEDSSSEGDILKYSDVYDYQGLESNLVILVIPRTGEEVELSGGIVLTREEHLARVFYTGMSRAHTMLTILANKDYEPTLRRRWPDYDW